MNHPEEVVVATASQFRDCCAHLAALDAFGFDTEFIGEESYHPQLCLVQVATPDRLYLIDPIELENLSPFWELVANAEQIKVVHAGREEIRMCARHLDRPPANIFDLQIMAGLLGAGYPTGHAALVQQFLKIRLAKGETLTDWSRRPLDRQQIRYAYDDVRFLLPLYEKFRHKLRELKRMEWLQEEHTGLMKRSLIEDPEREPWRKLRGLGTLDRQQLAVVREVFSWRERRAAAANRPMRYMLRDDLIVEIAKRMPSSERELVVMRGMAKHDLPGLLAAIRAGRELAAEQRPKLADRDNDPPQVAQVTNLLHAVLASLCAETKLTPALVATSGDLKALVRAQMYGQALAEDCALASGWRAEFVLPVLRDVVQGRRRVRVGRLNDPAPLHVEPL